MSRVAPLLFGLVCVLGLGVVGFDLRMAARHATSSVDLAPTVSADPARAVLADCSASLPAPAPRRAAQFWERTKAASGPTAKAMPRRMAPRCSGSTPAP